MSLLDELEILKNPELPENVRRSIEELEEDGYIDRSIAEAVAVDCLLIEELPYQTKLRLASSIMDPTERGTLIGGSGAPLSMQLEYLKASKEDREKGAILYGLGPELIDNTSRMKYILGMNDDLAIEWAATPLQSDDLREICMRLINFETESLYNISEGRYVRDRERLRKLYATLQDRVEFRGREKKFDGGSDIRYIDPEILRLINGLPDDLVDKNALIDEIKGKILIEKAKQAGVDNSNKDGYNGHGDDSNGLR